MLTNQPTLKTQSPFWEASNSSGSQQIARILYDIGSLPYSQQPADCPYPEPH